jgi:hypothetical protein
MPELADVKFGTETRREIENFFKIALGDQCLSIKPIEPTGIQDYAKKVVEYHKLAHGWELSSNFDLTEKLDQVTSQLPAITPARTHIRAIIEALDQYRLTGEIKEIATQKLTEYQLEEDESFFQGMDSDNTET